MTRVAAVLLVALIVSCGSTGTAGPSPTASPIPSPVISAKGAITLKTPTVNATVSSPVTISGDASVFEAALAWRITDTGGRVIAEGFTTASLGAPGRGTYSISATYTVPAQTLAFIEVFSRSAKDGSIDEIVRIPVMLR
ncbi:MAG TPA: Gmad2 immunoglobulin-like domain-containing protein [Candidatus Limnocylindria bacterium]